MIKDFLSNKFNISALLVIVNFLIGMCVFRYLSGTEIIIVIILLLLNNFITFTMGVAKGMILSKLNLSKMYLKFMDDILVKDKFGIKKKKKKKSDTK
jgi:hypothetical protein